MTEPTAQHPEAPTPAHAPPNRKARIALIVFLAAVLVVTFGGERMGWITNVATRDRQLDRPPEQAVAAVRSAAASMPRWTPRKDDGQVLEWESRTKLLGFVDDVKVELHPAGTGTNLHLRSASRVGASDFGTNGRRLDAFLEALDAQLK